MVYLHENFRHYSRGNAESANLKIVRLLIKCFLLAAVSRDITRSTARLPRSSVPRHLYPLPSQTPHPGHGRLPLRFFFNFGSCVRLSGRCLRMLLRLWSRRLSLTAWTTAIRFCTASPTTCSNAYKPSKTPRCV